MDNNENKKGVTLNQETVDILVTNIIPTTKYFEFRFDAMQKQFDDLKMDINKRFEQIDNRFETMQADIDKRFETMQADIDKRFEQVDKRFEQVDKRFEQVEQRIDKLSESIYELTLEIKESTKRQEVFIRDYVIDRDRHYDQKFARHRNYFLGIVSIVVAIILKMMGIIELPKDTVTIQQNRKSEIIKNK